MNKISGKIQLGTKLFMRIQHVSLALVAFLIASILLVVYSIDAPSYSHIDGLRFAAAFLAGVVLIALAGWIGILATTMANVRVTQAAQLDGLAFAFHIAYKSGTVNGMATSGLGLFGVSIIYYLMTLGHEQDTPGLRTFYSTDVLSAFGFGVSLTALFVRLAGGIFSKVRKIEQMFCFHINSFVIFHKRQLL
jgi:K(+)-stimulated pyrophosphate-energized sodium pump